MNAEGANDFWVGVLCGFAADLRKRRIKSFGRE
jgi:hypothetical protein